MKQLATRDIRLTTGFDPMPNLRSPNLRPFFSALLLSCLSSIQLMAEQPLGDAQLTLIENTSVSVSIAGRVERLSTREGSSLVSGDPLLVLETELVERQIAAASEELAIATLQCDNDVDQRYARMAKLVSQQELKLHEAANTRYPNSIAITEIDRLRLARDQASLAEEKAVRDLEIARATQRLQQAKLAYLESQFAQHTVRAPFHGMVVEIHVRPGEWAEPGKPVARIVSLERLRAEILLDGHQFDHQLLEQPVLFELDQAQATTPTRFAGKIVFVSPELQPVTGKVRAWAEVANQEMRLRPGMQGQLILATAKIDPAPAP